MKRAYHALATSLSHGILEARRSPAKEASKSCRTTDGDIRRLERLAGRHETELVSIPSGVRPRAWLSSNPVRRSRDLQVEGSLTSWPDTHPDRQEPRETSGPRPEAIMHGQGSRELTPRSSPSPLSPASSPWGGTKTARQDPPPSCFIDVELFQGGPGSFSYERLP